MRAKLRAKDKAISESSVGCPASKLKAVSYTHLDVYKRQLITQGRTRDRVYSTTYSQLVIAGHNRTVLTDDSEFYDEFYQVIEVAPGVILK